MPTDADARVAAIYRQDKTIIPDGSTVIEENDTVFFLAAQRNIRTMMKELRPLDNPVRRIILAGGGNIGSNLARQLERNHHVKIIERDPERAEAIAENLEKGHRAGRRLRGRGPAARRIDRHHRCLLRGDQ